MIIAFPLYPGIEGEGRLVIVAALPLHNDFQALLHVVADNVPVAHVRDAENGPVIFPVEKCDRLVAVVLLDLLSVHGQYYPIDSACSTPIPVSVLPVTYDEDHKGYESQQER